MPKQAITASQFAELFIRAQISPIFQSLYELFGAFKTTLSIYPFKIASSIRNNLSGPLMQCFQEVKFFQIRRFFFRGLSSFIFPWPLPEKPILGAIRHLKLTPKCSRIFLIHGEIVIVGLK